MSQTRSLGRRYYEDLLSGDDVAVADEILHPQLEFYGPISREGIYGIPAYKEFALRWYRGFPDRRFTVVEEFLDGDRIAILFRITGTHQGDFMGAAPTGNPIEVNGMNFFRAEDGLLREIRAFFDPRELLRPLGLVPSA